MERASEVRENEKGHASKKPVDPALKPKPRGDSLHDPSVLGT
jgi:hypothetical protein